MDNCRSSDGDVEGLTEEYSELEILSMVNVGLTSLSKLPSLPKLRKVSVPASFPGTPSVSPGLGLSLCVLSVGGQ